MLTTVYYWCSACLKVQSSQLLVLQQLMIACTICYLKPELNKLSEILTYIKKFA